MGKMPQTSMSLFLKKNRFGKKSVKIMNLDVSVDDPVFMKAGNCLKKLPSVSSHSEKQVCVISLFVCM